jgi:TonB family protein
LQRNRQYPASARSKSEQGTAVLAFTINRQGKVTSAHIARSSGSAALDEQTLALVHGVSFPPPPAEMSDRQLNLDVPVKYNLERSLCDSFGFYGYVFCHLIKPTQPPSPATLTVSSNAGATADSTKGVITPFRDHLKICSRLPAGVNVTDNARVVLRIFLKPDGTLAAPPQPIRIEGLLRGEGGDLYQSIVAALRECQPYNMLPPNKYDEWKVFDISFTPQNFLRRASASSR